MAALTTQQKRGAARWWIRMVFRNAGVPPSVHWQDVSTAFDDSTTHLDAAPTTGPTSNVAAYVAAINGPFKTKVSSSGVAIGPALAYLFAATAQAVAGAFD